MNGGYPLRFAVALLAVSLACCALAEDLQVGDEFEPNETLESLAVDVQIGADSEDLAEPVALDLGLGFPVWLHPLGRTDGDDSPFGAVLQDVASAHLARAGTHTRFTFELGDHSRQDRFRNSSQLLAGVRVSDIGRIGFISPGDSDWILQGYDIEINGKPFAIHHDVNASVRRSQEEAGQRIAQLNEERMPLEQEAEDISAFVDAGLATDEDQTRLQEILQDLTPLQAELERLQRQIEGSYPWFEEAEFVAPGRSESPVGDVRVTLLTAAHPGAGTANYVYYQTGGHKYLLSSPMNPLSADFGPQVFQVDTLAGPLSAADLRGHAVGMLAHAEPYATAPDRWHPQRIIVEVDERVVYDSEEAELDRLSLAAIRVIPPAHIDQDGELVENAPVARETLLWEAGSAQGLDLAHGGALELPLPDDSQWPQPEPGLSFDQQLGSGHDQNGFPLFPGEGQGDAWDVPGDDLPGEDLAEDTFDEPWDDPWVEPWDDPWNDPWDDPWDDWNQGGGGGGGWVAPPSWLDMLFHWLVEATDLVDIFVPDPFGDPIQVDNVRFQGNLPGAITVTWDVHGDDSEIAHYLIQVVLVRPHQDPACDPADIWFTTEPVHVHQTVISPAEALTALAGAGLGAMTEEELLGLYVAPLVTPIRHDGFPEPGAFALGAARAILPGSADVQPLPFLARVHDGSGWQPQPISVGPPPGGGRAMWLDPEPESHNAVRFENTPGSWHIGFRTIDPADQFILFLRDDQLPEDAQFRIAGHTGFLGVTANSAAVNFGWLSRDAGGAPIPAAHEIMATSPSGASPAEFRCNTVPVPMTPLLPDWNQLDLGAHVQGGNQDPDHPPAIFGLRVIRR